MLCFCIVVESLTCIGNWTLLNGRTYLIGSLDVAFVTRLEDKIKCFMYKPTEYGGWRIAQSSEPSCDQLKSVKSGSAFRTMHLKKGTANSNIFSKETKPL